MSLRTMAMSSARTLFTAEQIRRRVAELGAAIQRDFAGRPLTVVAVLRGSMPFLCDLLAHLGQLVTVELIEASSYGEGTASSGKVLLRRYAKLDVAGRDVLLVDDIVDTGHTLAAVRKAVEAMGPRSVRACVLLDKPSRRQVEVAVDYRGFVVDNVFVYGYGLDLAGRCRDLPYIACSESRL
jgi:hypoxanthine phosphoribosyltransferase